MRAVVVGAGIVGLCAAWQLARRGWDVTVVDAGPIPNPHAASFDHHRLMRDFYPGEPGYTARISEAFEAWEGLWRDLGATLYIETGVLALSREAGDWSDRCRATLDETGLDYEVLAPAELERRHPFLEPEGVRFGLMRRQGGALMAERILGALAGRLRAGCAMLLEHAPATGIDFEGGRVRLAGRADLQADALVIAAGVGLPALVPDYASRLVPQRSTVVYADPPEDLASAWRSAPCWVDLGGADDLWGIAPVAGLPVKLGYGLATEPGDPTTGRATTPDYATRIIGAYRGRLRRIEDYALRRTVANFYMRAADERFILEQRGRTWIVSADSGHGFKFGALSGMDVADAVTGARSTAEVARAMAGLVAPAAL